MDEHSHYSNHRSLEIGLSQYSQRWLFNTDTLGLPKPPRSYNAPNSVADYSNWPGSALQVLEDEIHQDHSAPDVRANVDEMDVDPPNFGSNKRSLFGPYQDINLNATEGSGHEGIIQSDPVTLSVPSGKRRRLSGSDDARPTHSLVSHSSNDHAPGSSAGATTDSTHSTGYQPTPRSIVDERASLCEQRSSPYQSLPGNDSFRVLRIDPSSGGSLHCVLEITTLFRPSHSFEAISYVWGDATKRVPIYTAQGTISVTHNLHSVLSYLRLADRPRYVWADAACINQEDAAERNQQVQLMRQIYKSAARVVLWLDADTKNKAHLAFSVICSVASGGHLNGIPVGQANFYSNGMSSANMPDVPCRDGPPPVHFKMFWSAVQDLFNQIWFWRLWCVQEAALARQAYVTWGNNSISWEHVGLAAARIRTSYPEVLQQYPMEGIFNAYFIYRISNTASGLPPLKFSFLRLLALTRQFESTDARDRIYGLLGIPTTDSDPDRGDLFMIPDYEKSTQEVYTELAKKVLSLSDDLFLLSSIQHGDELRSDDQWPSWVPNWDRVYTHALSSTEKGPTAAPKLVGHSYPIETTQNNELIVRGLEHGTVGEVFEACLADKFPPGYIPAYSAWKAFIKNDFRSISRLAMVLSAGKTWYGVPVPDEKLHMHDFMAYLAQHGRSAEENANSPGSGNAQRFLHAAKNACIGRRPFIYHENNVPELTSIGIGPAAMRPDDMICIVFGLDLPVILRPLPDGRYRFIGECYIYDLMDERVVRVPGQGRGRGHFILI
jgi:heterokaryon incompatibility protein (HET)